MFFMFTPNFGEDFQCDEHTFQIWVGSTTNQLTKKQTFPENGWLEDDFSFWDGRDGLRGYVSFTEGIP